MRFYTTQHAFCCGVDLHARTMYVCVLDQAGEVRFHRNLPCRADAFLQAIEPFREDVGSGVECVFCWYWLADLCAAEQLELFLGQEVRGHDASSFYLLRTIPGIGQILALTIVYEIHTIERFAGVGNFLSYARLVKGSHSSAGKRGKPAGGKMGSVHLKWAFSEAAALFLRANPKGKKLFDRLNKKHGRGKAMGVLAAKLGRAAYFMLKRKEPFDLNRFVTA